MTVQSFAVVELGPNSGSLTDYSCEIAEFVPSINRTLVRKAATFGSPILEDKLGTRWDQVTITFQANPHGSSGLWLALWTAAQTTSGELFFQVRYSDAAVSTSNPRFTGWLKVASVPIGAGVNKARNHSLTFPARAVTGPLTS